VAEFDVLVAAHALLPRQPEPALADQLYPVAGEPDLTHAVAGRGPHRGPDIVRELRVDQHDRRGTAVTASHRPGLDTHPVSVPRT
jgi:hypothetical protein